MKYEQREQRVISMALQLLSRKLRDKSASFTTSDHSINYLRLQLEHLEQEVFIVLFLDNQNRLIACETVFKGTINEISIYPREIVKLALKHNAAAVILAHNHPSGIAEPSMADRRITERIQETLFLIDVKTLDHIVCGHGEYVSFAEKGWI